MTPPQPMVSLAVEAARLSPCRSKRGVVIFDDLWISSGFNHQPLPFTCDGSPECKANCGKTAIHAEQAAILRAAGDFVGLGANKRLVGAQILHIKVVDGQPVPSAGPSCMECSKLILQAGMVGMWLLLEDGWKFYEAAEFHRLSCEANGVELKK